MKDLVDKLEFIRLFLPWHTSGMSVDECSGSFFIAIVYYKCFSGNSL